MNKFTFKGKALCLSKISMFRDLFTLSINLKSRKLMKLSKIEFTALTNFCDNVDVRNNLYDVSYKKQ